MSAIPRHIGIIMDGNGRWAKRRGAPRTAGHQEGLEAAKRVIQRACDLGVQYVTLFTFSTENWKRAEDEVGFLMNLIATHLRAELAFYRKNGIRVLHMGDASALPERIVRELRDVSAATAHFTGTSVVLAINYGGQDEILRAFKKIPTDLIPTLTAETFAPYLDVPDMPPVDLVIRTSGELRLSNFMLWQTAYAEFYFSDDLWPDWDGNKLDMALEYYASRDRRFGGVT
jgi:undecaprenyl diphosphate synthase